MLASSYLVHGGEPLQTEEIISSIKQLAAKDGYNNIVVFDINAQFDWEQLLNKCQHSDLFAERTLVELRLHSDSISKQGNIILESILQKQDQDFCFLIRAPKLKAQTLNSKWCQHIQKHGAIKVAKPIAAVQWTAWVQQRLKLANFSPSLEVTEYLAKFYEGNLTAAAQCIAKLKLTLPAGALDLDQIKPYLDNSARFSIFDLTAAAIKGDCERTFSIINGLRNEGLDPVLILWGLTREVRSLLRLKEEMKTGASLNESARKLGLWSNGIPDLKNALDRLSVPKLEKILHQAHKIDTITKGINQGNIWEPLLSISLMLASSKTLITEDLTI